MRALFVSVIACACLATSALAQTGPAWRGYAGNAQHTAPAPAKAQKPKTVHWKTPVDLAPQNQQGFLLIHYASPMITASNTVILPVKTGPTNGFMIEARTGARGTRVWKAKTDFIFAPHDWTPSFPAHLTAQNRFYYAGAGGTVYYRDTPDLKTGATGQIAFYGNVNYQANKTVYNQHVMIDTPITADEAGNIYFGFAVTGSTPLGLKNGIARIGADGTGTWISAAQAAGDNGISEVAQNCAPAISADQSTIYIGVSDGFDGYLLGLDATTLAPKYKTMEAFAALINAFSKVREGAGTLLDNMLIFAGSETSYARIHSVDNLPILTVGKAGGRLKTGLHIPGGGNPISRVGLTCMRAMGMNMDEWGAKSLHVTKSITEILV